MRTNIILGILLTIISVTLFAQKPMKGIAGAGPDKIYVNLGFELLSKKMPFNDCIAYRIERKRTDEKSWKQLVELETTTSKNDFKDKLADAMKVVPNPLPVDFIPVEKVWGKVDEYIYWTRSNTGELYYRSASLSELLMLIQMQKQVLRTNTGYLK